MKLLYAKDLVDIKKKELKSKFKNSFFNNKYLAIIFIGNDPASKVFVKNKVEFGRQVGLEVNVYGQQSANKLTYDDIVSIIDGLNSDTNCIGIIVQLPLPDYLHMYKREILDRINLDKDVDMLHSDHLSMIRSGKIRLNTATVTGALELLKYYSLDDFEGKKISIIGQSNLIGRPLARSLKRQGGDVQVYDIDDSRDDIIRGCRGSDIVFSATGVPGLVDDHAISGINQIFVDFGYGMKDSKVCGDILFDYSRYKDKQIYITPVPGGVGRMTVVCLFENIVKMVGM